MYFNTWLEVGYLGKRLSLFRIVRDTREHSREAESGRFLGSLPVSIEM